MASEKSVHQKQKGQDRMRWAITVGAVSAASAVIIGAVSAHLRVDMSEVQFGWLETALRYQIWNTIGLLAVGVLGQVWQTTRFLILSAATLTAGILLFSGSLYIMATSSYQDLGIVTPFGGLCLIAGWLFLAVASLSGREKQNQL